MSEIDTLFETYESDSGETVTPDRAMSLPAFFQAVNLLAGDIAKIPIEVFEYQGEELLRAFPHLKRSALNWSLWLLAKTDHIGKMRVRVNGKLTTVYGAPEAIKGLKERMNIEEAVPASAG